MAPLGAPAGVEVRGAPALQRAQVERGGASEMRDELS